MAKTISIETDPHAVVISNGPEVIGKISPKHNRSGTHYVVYNWNSQPVGIFLDYGEARTYLTRVMQAWAKHLSVRN